MTNTQHTNENSAVHFKVKGYNGHEKDRASAGITNGFHGSHNPNDVVILREVADISKARTSK